MLTSLSERRAAAVPALPSPNSWYIPLALAASAGPLTVLFNGAAGTTGNVPVTAFILALPPLIILLMSRVTLRLNVIDAFFLVFALAVAVSTLKNGITSLNNEGQFVIALLCYPAARFVPINEHPFYFIAITSLIVGAGAAVTGLELARHWDIGTKLGVFGFGHAATVFLMLLGVTLISVVTQVRLDMVRTAFTCGLMALPVAIFAAAQVRYTFVAIGIALLAAFVVSKQRLAVAIIMAAFVVSAVTGLAVRHRATAASLHDVAVVATKGVEPGPASCSSDNTIVQRGVILREAMHLVPSAGLFGAGLSSLASISCYRMDPHVSMLQATIDFGYIGGLAFAGLLGFALLKLWPLAGGNEAAFVLCMIIFLALLDLAHGRLEGDNLFLLFAGYAARLHAAKA